MMLDMYRRVRMFSLLVSIVGGLWLLAQWRAGLTGKAPDEFSHPIWNWENLVRNTDNDDSDRPSVIDRLKRDLHTRSSIVMPS